MTLFLRPLKEKGYGTRSWRDGIQELLAHEAELDLDARLECDVDLESWIQKVTEILLAGAAVESRPSEFTPCRVPETDVRAVWYPATRSGVSLSRSF